jgi:hypothetical protein
MRLADHALASRVQLSYSDEELRMLVRGPVDKRARSGHACACAVFKCCQLIRQRGRLAFQNGDVVGRASQARFGDDDVVARPVDGVLRVHARVAVACPGQLRVGPFELGTSARELRAGVGDGGPPGRFVVRVRGEERVDGLGARSQVGDDDVALLQIGSLRRELGVEPCQAAQLGKRPVVHPSSLASATMLKLRMIAVLVALVVPVAALADGAPTPASTASQICKQAQTSMGAALFAQTYGTNASKSNAFGKCVSKNAGGAQQDVSNAAKRCKAEQADATFAASHGGKTFTQFYGTNVSKGKGTGANAFGKCVSQAASASADAQATAATGAAKSCKAALKASAADFATKYGSSHSAFGKCVAAASKTTK